MTKFPQILKSSILVKQILKLSDFILACRVSWFALQLGYMCS